MKLTDWFDGSKFVPAHVGVYETDYFSSYENPTFQKWDGIEWKTASWDERMANRCTESSFQQKPNWRGLAEQPK